VSALSDAKPTAPGPVSLASARYGHNGVFICPLYIPANPRAPNVAASAIPETARRVERAGLPASPAKPRTLQGRGEARAAIASGPASGTAQSEATVGGRSRPPIRRREGFGLKINTARGNEARKMTGPRSRGSCSKRAFKANGEQRGRYCHVYEKTLCGVTAKLEIVSRRVANGFGTPAVCPASGPPDSRIRKIGPCSRHSAVRFPRSSHARSEIGSLIHMAARVPTRVHVSSKHESSRCFLYRER
jgi:hypothetical protein